MTPAAPKRIPAGQLLASPASIISATKIGIRQSRATVSAFGICASGAGIARAAMGEGYGYRSAWNFAAQ